ncbi:MAG: hypothetical protein ACKOXT_04665 [Actinomycetota bacterium]
MILIGYLVLFFVVVSFHEEYSKNSLLAAFAGMVLLITGLAAWIWSVQPKKEN